ncbi:MAG TPA: hypothetical protein VFW71_09150 [Actinomycetota bacterium]|nr:hypothetical protein [Actinomycetota bacterium]
MSEDGADFPEMRDRPNLSDNLSDKDLDRLLAGKTPEGADPLDRELGNFARDVRAAFCEAPDPEVERQHIAAAVAASRLTTDPAREPAVVPAAGPWWRRAPGASGQPKWRRRTVFSSLFASLTAKILTVALAAAAATGGLAAAGSLPGPAQQAVADAASTIGITLPTPHHDAVTVTAEGDQDGQGVSGTVGVSGTMKGDDDHEVSGTVNGDDVSGTATAAVNHGNCVSFAAHAASTLGLKGSQKGQFVSFVAQDASAVSAKVAEGGTPDAACQVALVAAKAAVGATANGKHHDDGVTGTVTPAKGDDQGENAGDQGENQKGDKDDHGVTPTVTSTPTAEHGSGHEGS